ncbi:hypothetical protein B0H10DRAFT_673298 [Mycena sp. CBHHK59/15]|nr:hypothetical protein B0H10DRAFT_673298 [Mycena sp. CBHHK59/15]
MNAGARYASTVVTIPRCPLDAPVSFVRLQYRTLHVIPRHRRTLCRRQLDTFSLNRVSPRGGHPPLRAPQIPSQPALRPGFPHHHHDASS